MKIEEFKGQDEQVLWKGKPNKSVFIKERLLSPFLFIAAIWLLLDCSIIMFTFAHFRVNVYIMIPFYFLHLFPVWIYLYIVISSFKLWRHTEYMITDMAVYCQSGVFTTYCVRKTFQEITNASVHQGFIDRRHDVGDVYVMAGATLYGGRMISQGINIVDIEDYMKVYKLINQTSTDIYSDTMYPNNLRPENNDGYKTKYNKRDE